MRVRRFLPFLTVLLLLACSTIDCPVENIVEVRYAVKAFDGDSEVADTLKDTLNVWATRQNRNDTLIYNHGYDVKAFSLPVSYTNPEDVLVFQVTDSLNQSKTDTVWITKENTPHFESVDCPTRYFHQLTAVRSTHVRIDTIIINNPSVTYDSSVKHLHIYFKD